MVMSVAVVVPLLLVTVTVTVTSVPRGGVLSETLLVTSRSANRGSQPNAQSIDG